MFHTNAMKPADEELSHSLGDCGNSEEFCLAVTSGYDLPSTSEHRHPDSIHLHRQPHCQQQQQQQQGQPQGQQHYHHQQCQQQQQHQQQQQKHHHHQQKRPAPSSRMGDKNTRTLLSRWPVALSTLIIFLSLLPSPATATARIAILLSQKSADQVSEFTVRELSKVLQRSPVNIFVQTKSNPMLPSLARADISNRLAYRNISLVFERDTVGIWVRDVRVRTVANLTNQLWPMSFGHERIDMDLQVKQAYVSIGMGRKENQRPHRGLNMESCTIEKPDIDMHAQNYWMLDKGLRFASTLMSRNFNSFVCPMVGGAISAAKSQLASQIPLTLFVNRDLLPEELKAAKIQYELASLRVQNGRLAADLDIGWVGVNRNVAMALTNSTEDDIKFAINDSVTTTEQPPAFHLFQAEFTQSQNNNSVNGFTVWINDQIVNEMSDLMTWQFLWMEEEIPVTDPKIPKSSRDFLSALCIDCFFRLKLYNRGAPRVFTSNSSTTFNRFDLVELMVVNPRRNVTAVFVQFLLNFRGKVNLFVENGILRASVDLIDAPVRMEAGAFPAQWSFFIEDLIQGMIQEVMWPEIKKRIEAVTLKNGIPLPTSCGIDPASVEILRDEGRFGMSANLRLDDFDFNRCRQDFKSSIPKPKAEQQQQQQQQIAQSR